MKIWFIFVCSLRIPIWWNKIIKIAKIIEINPCLNKYIKILKNWERESHCDLRYLKAKLSKLKLNWILNQIKIRLIINIYLWTSRPCDNEIYIIKEKETHQLVS